MKPTAFPEIELILKQDSEIKALAQHGIINYLKTFELYQFTEFLEKIKHYNGRFTRSTFYPEKNGRTKFTSSSFHRKHWSALLKPSVWIALGQLNSRVDQKIQTLHKQWWARIVRALPTSEELARLIEGHEFLLLEKSAKAAWQEIHQQKIENPQNQVLYEQIIFYLKPFINSSYFLTEKNRVLNDLLARLHVSSHSEESSVDDIVHYVLSCLNRLGVIDQLKDFTNERQTDRFLKNPHYCGMDGDLYSKIIALIERHGSKRHILSLHQLPIFNEHTPCFPSKNFSRKGRVFAVPTALADDIPRFKPWPAWMFPNRYFRYQYFRKKHALLHILKTTAPEKSKKIILVDQSSLEKIKRSATLITEEFDKIRREIDNIQTKSSRNFLERWKAIVEERKNYLEKKLSSESNILQSIASPIPIPKTTDSTPNPSSDVLSVQESSVNVKSYPRLNAKQKKILNHFFHIHSQKNIGTLTLKKLSQILKVARASQCETEDFFNHECRRYLSVPFFETLAQYWTAEPERAKGNPDSDTQSLFASCLSDYFMLSAEPAIKEYRLDFNTLFRKILAQQLQNLCEKIIQDYGKGLLSHEKISDYHTYLRTLLAISDQVPRLHNWLATLGKELVLIQNPHILEVKCRAILDGISTHRPSASTLFWKKSKPPSQITEEHPINLAEGAAL